MFRGSRVSHGVTALGILLGGLTAWLCQPAEVSAADHIDFPEGFLVDEPVADITELMSWTPSPGRIALAVDMHPFATPETKFSDALDHQFRLRRVEMEAGAAGIKVPIVSSEEHVIKCHVEGPEMTCLTPAGPISTVIGETNTEFVGKTKMSLFAGLRADPFFLDITTTRSTLKSGAPGETPTLTMPGENPANFSDNLNVLSIVLEFDVEAVLGRGSSTFAVVVETAAR